MQKFKNIILTDKGLKAINAPEKPKESLFETYNPVEWDKYTKALQQAIKEGVYFKNSNDGIVKLMTHSEDVIEKDKPYPIPDGYEVRVEIGDPVLMDYDGIDSRGDYIHSCPKCGYQNSYMGGGEVHCFKDVCREYAILVPKKKVRDWIEDFSHENGNYQNKCIRCGELFLGHKRRVVCKGCMEKGDDYPVIEEIKIGDNVTLIDRPCSGYVTKILPLEKERWGFRSQKILVKWEAYSGAFQPTEYQRLRDIKKIKAETPVAPVKQQSIEEAAAKYVAKRHKNSDNPRRFNETACERDFIAGAKSQAAKEYWYEQFKQEKQHCPYCGNLDWTIEKYGIVLHKEMCPYHQGNVEQFKEKP